MEAAGPYRFGVELRVETGRLVFVFVRGWLGPLPLPGWLAVRIESTVTADAMADAWWISVAIYAPLLGLLARYEGEVHPDWKQR
jgi:hypothetical protein